MDAPKPDLVNTVAATAKLYVFAALDEMETAARAFLIEIARVRDKYKTELTPPDAFALLLSAAERFPHAASNPQTTTGRFRTDGAGLPRVP